MLDEAVGDRMFSDVFTFVLTTALLYLVTLLLSVGYWMFDSLSKKPTPAAPRFGAGATNGSSGNLETTRFGGKYGAVVSDTF
jgi:hypothetical protein